MQDPLLHSNRPTWSLDLDALLSHGPTDGTIRYKGKPYTITSHGVVLPRLFSIMPMELLSESHLYTGTLNGVSYRFVKDIDGSFHLLPGDFRLLDRKGITAPTPAAVKIHAMSASTDRLIESARNDRKLWACHIALGFYPGTVVYRPVSEANVYTRSADTERLLGNLLHHIRVRRSESESHAFFNGLYWVRGSPAAIESARPMEVLGAVKLYALLVGRGDVGVLLFVPLPCVTDPIADVLVSKIAGLLPDSVNTAAAEATAAAGSDATASSSSADTKTETVRSATPMTKRVRFGFVPSALPDLDQPKAMRTTTHGTNETLNTHQTIGNVIHRLVHLRRNVDLYGGFTWVNGPVESCDVDELRGALKLYGLLMDKAIDIKRPLPHANDPLVAAFMKKLFA